MTDIGNEMYQLLARLFPLCRSLTGEGVRETLRILKETIPPLQVYEVPTGTKAFDWEVPKEWNISDAYVLDEAGNKIIDFKKNNLHVVGYSTPVDKTVSREELEEHLYSLKDYPEAIPYITSYYKERWGFCLSQNQRDKITGNTFRVFIESTLSEGHLTYGEYVIPGKTTKEIFISTYICHPSMANNELSGPVVAAYLAKSLASKPGKYTYRFVFVPETLGSITYLSRNLSQMKTSVIAGFNLTCVGDERAVSFLPSRRGNTLADKVALNVLSHKHPAFTSYSYLDRGSDERQYCSPGVDLPVVSIMRSKYGTYPEYHTSMDNLSLVSARGLLGSLDIYMDCIEALENNAVYISNFLCEPQLGKRGLYPTLSTKATASAVKDMMNFLAYADGKNDLIEISNIIKVPVKKLLPIVASLLEAGVIRELPESAS